MLNDNIYYVNYRKTSDKYKLNIDPQIGFNSHRGGWGVCMKSLESIHNANADTSLIGFLDLKYGNNIYEEFITNRTRPTWVGFLHNPPNLPDWYNYSVGLKGIVSDTRFLNDLKTCKGLYTTSIYTSKWLRVRLPNIYIETIHHPYTEDVHCRFNMDAYKRNFNKSLVDVGTWCRRFSSIYILSTSIKSHNLVKLWPGNHGLSKKRRENIHLLLQQELNELDREADIQFDNINHLTGLDNKRYDEILSRNVVFLDFWDTSANNTVLECIDRHTPLLVRKHPAVVEYLSDDYPLYYNCLTECRDLINDIDLISQAHEFMKSLQSTGRFSLGTFKRNIINSSIYDSL